MIFLFSISLIICSILTWIVAYWYFRRKILFQTKKMIQMMKSDELGLEKPQDIYDTDNDAIFFSDLERASFSLRKKYLRLKKNTQQEKSAFETIFSGLQEGVVTVDKDLRVISFNSSFLNMFKWVPDSKADTDILPAKNMNPLLQDIIRDPEILMTFKNVFKFSNSILVDLNDFQLHVRKLPEIEDQSDWALGVFYDTREISRIEKMKIELVANASHELRTPLTSIKGYADFLNVWLENQKPLFPNEVFKEGLKLLKPIQDQSQNMAMLIDDLLNLSKLDQNLTIEKQQLSTHEMTELVLNEVQGILPLYEKTVLTYFDCEFVTADPYGVRQVLRNLLVNAVKYSGKEERAKQINVRWKKTELTTILEVQDFGPGISEKHQNRIFERFYRIDKGRDRERGGSGLGLAIVKHQMLNHEGSVLLISTEGEGCLFVCEFPKR